MRDPLTLFSAAFAFVAVLLAGAQLAWAVGPCSGTVSSTASGYDVSCAGQCEPDATGPCQSDGGNPLMETSGTKTCICGDPEGLPSPPNGPCMIWLNWSTTEHGKMFTVLCMTHDCVADCEPEFVGIQEQSGTMYLYGSGTVKCKCP